MHWKPASIPPPRPGFYKVYYLDPFNSQAHRGYRFWTGSDWVIGGATPDAAHSAAALRIPARVKTHQWSALSATDAVRFALLQP